jgi:predicted Rdx family selenoprotein
VATELAEGHIRETDITLTPVHEGRFEIYINGKKVYDRKESRAESMEKDFLPALREIGKAKQILRDEIGAAPAPATATATAAH